MTRRKRPWLAAVLNLLYGLGYLYNGRRKVFGGLLFTAAVAAWVQGFYLSYTGQLPLDIDVFGTISGLLVTIAFMYDAYQEAKAINEE